MHSDFDKLMNIWTKKSKVSFPTGRKEGTAAWSMGSGVRVAELTSQLPSVMCDLGHIAQSWLSQW